jgi:hypothetical protein
LAGFAVVVLNEVHIQPSRLLKVPLVEAFEEEASVIDEDMTRVASQADLVLKIAGISDLI